MFGHSSFVFLRLFGARVETNVEVLAIIVATGLFADSWKHGALVVASFAVGTGLHLGCHWLVAVLQGKGIARMVLTRAGRIEYTGAPPSFAEEVLRTSAGPAMNALCAAAAYGALAAADASAWPPMARLATETFAVCSLILAAINFLPAIPFDGGLILRAVLQRSVGPDRARRLAAIVSLCLLASMTALGLWTAQPILVYLGVAIAYDNWLEHLVEPHTEMCTETEAVEDPRPQPDSGGHTNMQSP